MCVASTGKVKSVDGKIAEVDFMGNIVRARYVMNDLQPGDRVLVHAGLVIQKVSEQQNDDFINLFSEIEEASRG